MRSGVQINIGKDSTGIDEKLKEENSQKEESDNDVRSFKNCENNYHVLKNTNLSAI